MASPQLPASEHPAIPWLRSPTHCIAFLALLATASSYLAFHFWPIHRQRILPQFFSIAIALLILPTTTNLSLGEYPPARPTRLRRWIFLAIKLALILPIVFCGTFDLGIVIGAAGLQPHATLVGYILAFRWVLTDQRRRCPVCLRLLTNPTRIGEPSHTFLEWYGTELICTKGHGLLHVPEIPTCSFRTQCWLYLDPSWRSLFS